MAARAVLWNLVTTVRLERGTIQVMTRAGLDKKPVDVATMFDKVARRYDITNTVLSFGQDRRWRQETVRAVAAKPGQKVLDLAAGTGVSSEPYLRSGVQVVPCDFSVGMLSQGRVRNNRLPFVAGDAMALPFPDNTFDAVTISFGLRNVADTKAGLAEMLRVTKPGGRIVVAEFSTPTWGPFRTLYMEYLMKALPSVARAVSSNPEAYVYLAESIRDWPAQMDLGRLIKSVGWQRVQFRNLTGGIVALHRGFKGATEEASS